MTSVSAAVRKTSRRGALLGLQAAFAASGAFRRADSRPGATLLLIHNTPKGELGRLLRFVDRRRADVVDFGTAISDVAAGASRPMISLTFDDGFISNLDAGRELAARGISACFYVPTGVIGLSRGEVNAFFRRPQQEGVMTWDDIEELKSLGHVIGSHCRQHLPLSEMPIAEAEDQIKQSVTTLRDRLGECRDFAWPFGGLRHAPIEQVVKWCSEVDVCPASGVRGRNTRTTLSRLHYLHRDPVELRWIATDYAAFVTRHDGGRD